MRVLRVLKRALALLLFVCMTLLIQLELRVLRTGRNIGGYTPWWGNETLGHLRAFPKLAARPSTTYSVLRNSSNAAHRFIPSKIDDVVVNKRLNPLNKSSGSALKASSGDLTRVPLLQVKNSDPNSSYRKILSDTTSRNSGILPSGSNSVFWTTRGITLNVKALESQSNYKTRVGMFAKLKIYDGEHTIDTDTIYNSQKRANVIENPNKNNSTSINQRNGKFEIPTRANQKKMPMVLATKIRNSTKASKYVVPLSKLASILVRKKIKFTVAKAVSHDIDKNEMSLTKEEITDIKAQLRRENERQTVHNQDTFGPVMRNTTIVLVQVHKRLENLRYLVSSLRAVKDIERAVVVFSHDFWDPDINLFVRNITAFRVMQMFFPYSIQLYPHVFPGRDPQDCSWNTNTSKALQQACQNAKWPDSYGHYREASYTQIKHHWWWKIHRVFEDLVVTQGNYTGHVVFLEEDHYVSPDLLHALTLLQRLRPALCPACQVLALGNYNKLSPRIYKNFVERGDWWVNKYNLGFAMDASLWSRLTKCKDKFCHFDDYNWDWTMTNVVQTCLPQRLLMLSVRLTRVLHLGSCGTHVRKKGCDVKAEVRNAVSRFASSREWLFPETLALQGSWKSSGKPKRGNGGWGDYRDRQLCLAIGNHTADEATLGRLQGMRSS